MADKILLFPTLTPDLLKKVRFQKSKFSFFYTDKNDEEHELYDEPVEALSAVNIIKDEEGKWDQDKNNIGFRRKYVLRTFRCLFGKNGVACEDAVLGLAVIWTSSDSKQRGVIPVATFTAGDLDVEAKAEKLFLKAQLRGQVDFTTVIYIDSAGNPSDGETHLANTDGFVLGELETYTVQLDGKGSVFPVFEGADPGGPLWRVQCDWEDPAVDAFSECVSINLNTAHKSYKFIDRDNPAFNSAFLSEVMAAAISVIVEQLRNSPYWEQIVSNDSLEDGSVGQALYYFRDALGWNLENPESVSVSVRRFFDQRM